MALDYSAIPSTKKDLLKLVEEDKGNKIISLNNTIAELDATLESRLKVREDLEISIAIFKQQSETLAADVVAINNRYITAQADLSTAKEELETTQKEERRLSRLVSDLESQRVEQLELVTSIKKLTQDEAELIQSIKIKEKELRALQVKIEPLKEKESQLIALSHQVEETAAQNLLEAKALESKTKELRGLIEKNTEQIRYIDLSGKTMGYYIRAVQKKFDEMNIKIDFIKLLHDI